MRQIFEYAKMALRNIIGNKMRSLLTMLGIIIGISAVIIVLCIGAGGQKSIEDQLSGIANGAVYLYTNTNDNGYSDWFTNDDLLAIQEMDGVAAVSMMDGLYGTVRTERGELNANVMSGNADYNIVSPATILNGRFWDEGDYASARRVCTIDSAAAKELFGSDNVVGMTVTVKLQGLESELTIVGVTQPQNITMGGMAVTAEMTVPLTTLEAIGDYWVEPYYQLAMLGEDANQTGALAQQAIMMIELRHGNMGREAYEIMDVSQYMDQFNEIITLFTTIIAAIAGISLLVGGIGVMNIMLVSVTERTREIGIRKALGAKTRTILIQFLIESATLTLAGGLIGILLGTWGGGALGGLFGIEASISWSMVFTIALFSSAIGIFFGIYPARKAARLNPIEALRSD